MVSDIEVLDSHTAGEPTRVILSVASDVSSQSGSLPASSGQLAAHHRAWLRSVIGEPRGAPALVGAWLVPPRNPACLAGVVFFDHAGVLGMCGHGAIGVIETLRYLGRLQPGTCRLETPVGEIAAELHPEGDVTITNVPSYRFAAGVDVRVPHHGRFVGDIAWGGNWFFLTPAHCALDLAHLDPLHAAAVALRDALRQQGIGGAGQAPIDHIEFFAASPTTQAHGRNYVLCPSGTYDRSPCGTGTSARLACLHAEGKLAPGELWRQEGILGACFDSSYQLVPGEPVGWIRPAIRGRAFITAASRLIFNPADPFANGIGE
jgi:4-hydroxyproline epimerase